MVFGICIVTGSLSKLVGTESNLGWTVTEKLMKNKSTGLCFRKAMEVLRLILVNHIAACRLKTLQVIFFSKSVACCAIHIRFVFADWCWSSKLHYCVSLSIDEVAMQRDLPRIFLLTYPSSVQHACAILPVACQTIQISNHSKAESFQYWGGTRDQWGRNRMLFISCSLYAQVIR